MASSAQIKAIHTIKSKLRMDDDAYRSNLKAYGVNSTTDPLFSHEMAGDFIQKLSRAANSTLSIISSEGAGSPSPASSSYAKAPADKSINKYAGKGKVGYNRHITPGRAARIGILEEILEWDSKRIRGFIYKQTGFNKSVEMLTSQEGGKVITGLTRIYANGNRDLYLQINKLSNKELRKLTCTYKSKTNGK